MRIMQAAGHRSGTIPNATTEGMRRGSRLPYRNIDQGRRSPTIVYDTELIRGKNVVAVIAFRDSSIYATDASPGGHPEHVIATDPHGRFHKVHHQAGNPKGTYEDDSPEYWEALADALSPAGAILLLGHGKGKANASHHFVTYVEKHRKDVAAKIGADVRVDIDHLTDEQVLRLARHYFARPPQ